LIKRGRQNIRKWSNEVTEPQKEHSQRHVGGGGEKVESAGMDKRRARIGEEQGGYKHESSDKAYWAV